MLLYHSVMHADTDRQLLLEVCLANDTCAVEQMLSAILTLLTRRSCPLSSDLAQHGYVPADLLRRTSLDGLGSGFLRNSTVEALLSLLRAMPAGASSCIATRA
jgi:hypothetical protein